MSSPPSDDGPPRTYHRGRKARKSVLVAALALAGAAVGWMRWRPFRILVEGDSMAPALRPGDWAVAIRPRRVRIGDVVVLEHPERPGFEIVKRVVAGPGGLASSGDAIDADAVWVLGDASDRSTDSRAFGAVPLGRVSGRVVAVWWPPSRWRSL